MKKPRKINLRSGIPDRLPEELVEKLAGAGGTRIERIVSRGHRSPLGYWYDGELSEFVLLLEGGAEILFAGDDEPVRLEPGDCLLIPPRLRHRVEWTAPGRETIWLAVFF